jgi:hypothetical protein
MFVEITVNNLFVLAIYAGAGLLVRYLTGSKLAVAAPWAVYGAHIIQAALRFAADCRDLGILPCLALVLPHAWLELAGYSLGCWAGSRLSRNRRPLRQLALAAGLVILGAFTETFITPFPLGHWLN